MRGQWNWQVQDWNATRFYSLKLNCYRNTARRSLGTYWTQSTCDWALSRKNSKAIRDMLFSQPDWRVVWLSLVVEWRHCHSNKNHPNSSGYNKNRHLSTEQSVYQRREWATLIISEVVFVSFRLQINVYFRSSWPDDGEYTFPVSWVAHLSQD
jgi:hypothetical protein